MAQSNSGDADADLLTLMRSGRLADAERECRRQLALRPDHVETLNNLGYVLDDLGRWDEAEAAYRRAIDLQPDFAGAHYNLGLLLQNQRRLEEADRAYHQAITLRPAMAQAHNNRGAALRDLRRLDEAMRAFDAAISLQPDYADAQFNQALCRLLMGDYAGGWAQYEWRWAIRQADAAQRVTQRPLWLGREALAGRTILLHAEQGLGDTLQFCRYARRVSALGARVLLQVQPGLERLMSRLQGPDQILRQGDPSPPYDLHTPLMSLPLALGVVQPEDEGPYLSADPRLAATWARKLAGSSGLRVGLVWAGAARPDQPIASAVDRRRSLPLEAFAPLFSLDGVQLYSLQKGHAAGQLDAFNSRSGARSVIIDHTAGLTDFAETAALVDNLDLVISCDTSVAHLAGAMGKPVWILSRFDGCWRWRADGETAPWYRSARLFRQTVRGEWADVIETVAAALNGLTGAG